MAERALPVTVVTGFLGSGKTTFVNDVLNQRTGLRAGVIVNEFGAINIDRRLITSQTDDVIELSNGCVCCTVQKDLLTTIGRLIASQGQLDYLVVETSGLADPLPLAQALSRPELAGVVGLDAIITLVDASRFDENLEQAEAAYSQLAHADVLLLNKVDLVTDGLLELMERGLRTVNPDAPIIRCLRAAADLGLVLDLAADRQRHAVAAHHPGEAALFDSVAFSEARGLDLDRLRALVDGLPAEVIRAKGIVHAAGSPLRLILQRVGERATIETDRPWGEEERCSELVFIGRRINRQELLADLDACVA